MQIVTENNGKCEQLLSDCVERIEELEAEVQEQCRLNGMGGERELAMLAKVERLERENAELRKQLSEQALQKLSDFNQEHGL
jgi:uncharacterized protein (UPF0335 family)